MKKLIKNLLKKNKKLVDLYISMYWLRDIPFKDYINIMKLNLILKVKPRYTMVNYLGLSNIYELAVSVEKNKVEGCFVECGVWRGGCAAVMAGIVRRFKSKRKIWLFDSFAGNPEPTPEDGEKARRAFGDEGLQGRLVSTGACAASSNEVIRLFSSFKLYSDNIIIKEGWFQDTLPKFKNTIGPIAILRLDGNWYESTKCCLENLYSNVISGGYIIIDDYVFWEGCRKATDEFLVKEKIDNVRLKAIDIWSYYFQKP